ncbi:baculoviral IAP repeat-containing protein 7-B-like [Bicyclus anynana]|uniref:Baculoviral IAP repeat-containing protein 7-B-like n=1 Tax=Bicyclus anynana TaxID=110368 RepID=A0A6J1P667_BICAN|nr:baculoviral IAP repeat-containing protein 7-B-like [Bicyclus anynana]
MSHDVFMHREESRREVVPAMRDERDIGRPVALPPKNGQFANKNARLRSFEGWPQNMRQTPEELAEAGFFYTGKEDAVLCFHCDGGLKGWKRGDQPWAQHAQWFDRCPFLAQAKGKIYIKKMWKEARGIPTNARCVYVASFWEDNLLPQVHSGTNHEWIYNMLDLRLFPPE